MAEVRTISQKISFLFTAVTLFCVMLLNNQEITTYRTLPKNSAPDASTHLKNTAGEKNQTVVKQKVSFEATTSYLVLQLACFAHWPDLDFTVPPISTFKLLIIPVRAVHFFSVLLAFTIVPNAP